MKLVKIFCVVALLAISAAAVKAGTIKGNDDPKVVIQKPGGGTGIADPGFKAFGMKNADPIDMVAVTYNGSGPLFSLLVGITSSAQPWQGYSNIFNGYSVFFTPPGFDFSGASSPTGAQCGDAAPGAPNVGCPGEILPGETIDISVQFGNGNQTGTLTIPASFSCANGGQTCSSGNLTVDATQTPEPSTMLLFFSLGPAIGFAKKRWNARQSA